MRLYLLRHGETEANIARICQGQTPGKLTPLGEEQAKRAAKRLKDVPFDMILVSDLNRTKQTAAPIIATHPEAQVVYEPRIRERNQGVYEGKEYGLFSDDIKRLGVNPQTHVPKGGESFRMVGERAKNYFDELIEQHKGKNVLVVSHGGFLTQTIFYLMNIEDNRRNYDLLHPKNTALSIFDIQENGNHKAKLLGCTEHLS